MNQMHGTHDIAVADMRYVLATFVVVPARWMQDFGWRALTATELRASVLYYHHLGRLMGITAVPATHAELAQVLTDTEDARFGFSVGGRVVADATLDLMTTFPPNHLAPKRWERWMPVRTTPKLGRQLPQIRGYPEGYSVPELGTFAPRTCPRRVAG